MKTLKIIDSSVDEGVLLFFAFSILSLCFILLWVLVEQKKKS